MFPTAEHAESTEATGEDAKILPPKWVSTGVGLYGPIGEAKAQLGATTRAQAVLLAEVGTTGDDPQCPSVTR